MVSRKLSLLMTTALVSLIPVNASQADDVINDDLIVNGSECVGFDCVNGESFGFDTLKLKENNLRIFFDDTSNSASFPSNDWRIGINSSSNGGASFFSVEDATAGRTPFTIRSGARANSIFVDQQGEVGFGTDTPVTDLHVRTGDTPTLRLEQDGSSGWTPQTWDASGNEANFFIRDVTNGSALPFRIRPGAPTSSIDLASDGDLGIGVGNPATKLHVVGGDGTLRISDQDTNAVNKFGYLVGTHFTTAEEELLGMEVSSRSTSNFISIGGGNDAYNAATVVRFFTAADPTTTRGTERMRFNASGQLSFARTSNDNGNILQFGSDMTNGNGASLTNAGVWTDASSRANKINITNLSAAAAIEAVKNMQPVTYNGKQDTSGETYVGFIAEEVPDLVAMNTRKGIASIEVSAVLTSVVKAHQETIESQKQHIESLEARLAALEAAIINNGNK